MSMTLTIRDETVGGRMSHELTLDILTERLTVRELIRSRVYQEVDDYNRRRPETFAGLVQPTDAETTLNGYKPKARRTIQWKPQYEKACEAFERNGFFILIDDKQAENLEDEIVLRHDTKVSFVKLMPLVGG